MHTMQSKSIAEIGLGIVQELEELSRFFLVAAGLFGFVFVGVVRAKWKKVRRYTLLSLLSSLCP